MSIPVSAIKKEKSMLASKNIIDIVPKGIPQSKEPNYLELLIDNTVGVQNVIQCYMVLNVFRYVNIRCWETISTKV